MFRLSIILALGVSCFLVAENEELTAARSRAAHSHAINRAGARHHLNHRAAYPYGNSGYQGGVVAPVTTYPAQTIPSQATTRQGTVLPANQVRQN